MRACSMLLLFLLSACQCQPPSPTTLNEYCDGLERRRCEKAQRCATGVADVPCEDTNRGRTNAACLGVAALVDAGRLHFEAAAAAGCVEALKQPGCDDPSACSSVLTSVAAVGDACEVTLACPEGAFCDSTTSCPGRCAEQKTEGPAPGPEGCLSTRSALLPRRLTMPRSTSRPATTRRRTTATVV